MPRRRREKQPTTNSLGHSIQVIVETVPVRDAEERLARAYDLVLRAAARAEEQASPLPESGKEQP